MAGAGTLRVVEREFHVFRRLWRGTIVTSVVQPILFLVAMGVGLGGLVDERTGDVAGLSYLEFVTPGLLVAGAMQSAAGNSLWMVLAGMKWIRHFHGMVATPLGPVDVFTGILLWHSLRLTAVAGVFLVVAAAFGGVPSAWGVLALPVAGLTAAAFAAPLSAYSATQESDGSFPVIIRLGVVPLFLFSATFFPIEQLPDALEGLAVLSPLWHGVELARAATTGSALSAGATLGHLSVLVGMIGAGTWWGKRTYERRLTP